MRAVYTIEIESDSHINVSCAARIFEEYFVEFRDDISVKVDIRDHVRYEGDDYVF